MPNAVDGFMYFGLVLLTPEFVEERYRKLIYIRNSIKVIINFLHFIN